MWAASKLLYRELSAITGDEKKFSSQPYKIASVGMFDISKGEVWNLGIRNIFLEDF